MNSMMKKIALLMSIIMLITCIPINAYAEENQLPENLTVAEESTDIGVDIEAGAEEPASPSDADTPYTVQIPETLPGSTSSEGTPSSATVSATSSDDGETVLEATASDGVKVMLTAKKGAFETDEGLELKMDVVTGEEADEAGNEIDKEEKPENVARRVTYDIRVEKDGTELQPLDGKKVSVCFSLPEVPSGADEVTVYHHDEKDGLEVIAEEDIKDATLTEIGAAEAISAAEAVTSTENKTAAETTEEITEEELDDFEDSELINDLSVGGETDSFSLYTVDFTYDDKIVSIAGNTKKNPLAGILEKVDITDPITDVEVYSDDEFKDKCEDGIVKDGDKVLFKVYKEDGTWYVDAVNSFSTTHGIIVKTDKADYRVKVTDPASDDFLTFTSVGTQSSVTFNYYSGNNVKYLTDKVSTWSDCPSGTTIHLADGEYVKFKGKNVRTATASSYHFSMTGTIAASGDVTSLTNEVGGYATLTSACYSSMFKNCTSLTTGPNIYATSIAGGSCYEMFRGCTNLTEVKGSLEGTFGQDSCMQMFEGCMSLTTAPEIKATKMLVHACFFQMFSGCTSLTEVKGSLEGDFPGGYYVGCCQWMFSGCTSLTAAPEIKATVVRDYCFMEMFGGCTSLTEVKGSISGSISSMSCYKMFSGCTSLVAAPEINAMKPEGCTYMFKGCASLSEVKGSIKGTVGGYSCTEMFSGCTSLTAAPEINITLSGEYSLKSMFKGCESLTEVKGSIKGSPSIECCMEMFSGCKKLTTAPEIEMTTSASVRAFRLMFSGCESLTEVKGSLEGTFWGNSCSEMFSGCTKLATAPEIKATELYDNCFNSTFKDCTSLTEVKGSLGGSFESNCCYSMFEGCIKLKAAPEIKATSSSYQSCKQMFMNCTNLIVHSIPDEDGIEMLFTGTAGSNWNSGMFTNCKMVDLDGSNSKVPKVGTTYYITAKAVPYLSNISATEITHGQTLSQSTPSGTAKYAENMVAGAWSFATPSIKPQLSDSDATKYGVIFTPTDTDKYKKTEGKTTITVNPGIYTVTYNNNGHGGAAPAAVLAVEGSRISAPSTPADADYIFKGWYKEAYCRNAWNFSTDTVNADITLYAKWEGTSSSKDYGQSNRKTWTATPSLIGTEASPMTWGKWVNYNGVHMYLDHGYPLENTVAWISYVGSDNKTYTGRFYFNKYGTTMTGWQNIDNAWYYFNTAGGPTYGMMLTGWMTDPQDGHRYYLDPATGKMATGWKLIDEKRYYFCEGSAMKSGWTQRANGKWVYDRSDVIPLGALIQ